MPKCQSVNCFVRITLCSEVIAQSTGTSPDLLKHSSGAGVWESACLGSAVDASVQPGCRHVLFFQWRILKLPKVEMTRQVHIVNGQGRT